LKRRAPRESFHLARNKNKREVERIVAQLRPLPDVSPMIRRLPGASDVSVAAPATKPFAAGGTADARNIALRCRAHNAFEAQLFFGVDAAREDAE